MVDAGQSDSEFVSHCFRFGYMGEEVLSEGTGPTQTSWLRMRSDHIPVLRRVRDIGRE